MEGRYSHGPLPHTRSMGFGWCQLQPQFFLLRPPVLGDPGPPDASSPSKETPTHHWLLGGPCPAGPDCPNGVRRTALGLLGQLLLPPGRPSALPPPREELTLQLCIGGGIKLCFLLPGRGALNQAPIKLLKPESPVKCGRGGLCGTHTFNPKGPWGGQSSTQTPPPFCQLVFLAPSRCVRVPGNSGHRGPDASAGFGVPKGSGRCLGPGHPTMIVGGGWMGDPQLP